MPRPTVRLADAGWLILSDALSSHQGEQVESDSDSDAWNADLKKGPLAQINFHRVILDEAQQIRNRNTRAAQACFNINSEFRWALTFVSPAAATCLLLGR